MIAASIVKQFTTQIRLPAWLYYHWKPRLDVHKEQLKYLLGVGFSTPQITITIGVGLSTNEVQNMTEYGFSVSALYSEITDIELDSIVKQIKLIFPNSIAII